MCTATIRRGPPQRGQGRTSRANARLIRSAHAQWRGFSAAGSAFTLADTLAAIGASPGGAPYETTRGSPGGIRREHPVVEHEVDPRPGRERSEHLEQRERLEQEMARAIRPRRLEGEHDAAIVQQQEPALSHRRAKQIAAEMLQARAKVINERAAPEALLDLRAVCPSCAYGV